MPYHSAAMSAAAGIVRTHAITIDRATPQRTAEKRLVAPTPTTDAVIVWVVDTGACRPIAMTYRVVAAVVSAAKPRGGSRWMMRRPSVRMIRQPPAYVPSEIAVAAATLTHHGIGSSLLALPYTMSA